MTTTVTTDAYPLFSIPIESEEDVVLARQRAREVSSALGFDQQDQIRMATAVSEIARNAYSYGGGGRIDFRVEGKTAPQLLSIVVRDRGPGIRNLDEIMNGSYRSTTGMGIGIAGSRRIVDRLDIQTSSSGTSVAISKLLPARAPLHRGPDVEAIATRVMKEARRRTPMEEVREQNRELVTALDDLRKRQEDLERLNRELEDTNRGVVALYAELDEKADHLRRADEMKTKFLSNMTHEFRTPLNSILALSKLLQDEIDGPLSEEQQKQVGFVRKAAEGLSDLVNDLLDIAKIEAGKTTVRPKEFAITELFSALRGMLRPLLINSTLSLVFDEPGELPLMISDEAKVSQILRNFISNALKFTEHGEVRVSVRHDRATDAMEFAVADTGIGIAKEDQQQIFREFGQIDNPIQSRVRGTGLGLPLTARLVELLGGRLTLDSEVGVGSTFRAILPRIYAPAGTLLPALTDATDARVPVLFVDDDMDTLMLYEKYLQDTKFRVMPARNLREARHGLNLRPKAIVLDILLVGDDAWSLLAELKKDASTRNTPILVITQVEDQHKAVALGANAYCVKPAAREWLVRTLTHLTSTWSILLIDDDEASRYVLSRALGELNCKVTEAGSGPEGLLCARSEGPDLIFLDLNLPEMSGVEVLQRLKADPVMSSIPVIVYTSRVLDDVLALELRGKAAAVLSKQQYDRDALLTAVKQLLPIEGP